MKYLALLSGGKDSCYNLVHCAKNGHELVAAASLRPEPGKEELDSYLYQTVGQDAIEFVAQALDVPLYRHVITGNAVEQGSEYGGRDPAHAGGIEGDETEDLFSLLSTVKNHHPDVRGVSVGAILSNYQRVRVEHVCRRLDLTPLCYLWQRDQGELLSEMIEAGMEAILIKVAGIGLTTKHLQKTLAEMQPTLVKLNDLYGSHICGEGGEYESLTLDCSLFKRKIVLTEVEVVIHSDNDFATVAYLRIKNAVLEDKAADQYHIPSPPLLDDDFFSIRVAIQNHHQQQLPEDHGYTDTIDESVVGPITCPVSSRQSGSWVAVTNIQTASSENISIEEEVTECFYIIRDELVKYNLKLSNCAHINIFLSSMDLFSAVNPIYATFFGTSPPARACVAVDLPQGIRVRMDCIAFVEKSSSDRQALHVQGLSYWAPANIGPYSQAIIVDGRIFVSGQIGLIPSHLVLPSPQSLATETALASQHVYRVIDALKNNSGGGWKSFPQADLFWLTAENDLISARNACRDSKNPTLFLAVKSLPKNALVEKQTLHHTGRCLVADEDEDGGTLREEVPIYEHDSLSSPGIDLSWEISRFEHSKDACAIVSVKGDIGPSTEENSFRACAYYTQHIIYQAISHTISDIHLLIIAGGTT
ncbi:hypothetical protein BDQ12DRAFT_718637 [Crucibulum laeve]|uniref:Diphthine--ammonia ligase n=1 Tax=Crucibulum laeve TaxID=68775 RepID=A0A5C3MDE1_9AGAR|nr:hypothetical protein BDQ12DRAFT_718637 [Crucibulum laeve]